MHSYWSVLLLRPLLLVGLPIYYFCVLGPEAFRPAVYALMVFNHSLLCFGLGYSHACPSVQIFKDVFLTFYSFDTVLLIII
jgi:hypothetical protein